jgi:hypothetical protein
VLVAFYYGITGIACAWAFRKVLLTKVSLFFLAGLLPFIGGIFLFWIGYEVVFPAGTAFSDDISTAAPVLITFALGIPLTIVAAVINKNGFFRTKTVSYVQKNGQLMAYIRGSGTMELAGAAAALTTPGATVDPAAVADPAQNLSSKE